MSLAERQVTELSGGQRQRVWIAMALAQETDILLLDEPTTYLDLAHQVELLDLLSDLNEQRGTTMIMVLHELNLAARVADYLVAMKDGSIVAQGEAHDVLTRENLDTIFGLKAEVADPLTTAVWWLFPIRGGHPQLPGQLSHPKKPPLISDNAPITVGYWKTGRTES